MLVDMWLADTWTEWPSPGRRTRWRRCRSGNSEGRPKNKRKPESRVKTDLSLTLNIFRSSYVKSSDLCEFWSRMTSRPLPTPDTTFLTFSSFSIFCSCMDLTSLLNSESLRLSCKLKAQQTPESVMTGVKISKQLTSFPCQEHRLSM